MYLKEEIEDPHTINNIYEILKPKEFTKLDELIHFVFSTAEDIKEDTSENEDVENHNEREVKIHPVKFHDGCIKRVENRLNVSLIKMSRSTYKVADNSLAVLCAVSKKHVRSN